MKLGDYQDNTIDASKECVRITNNNKPIEENIQNILTAYEKRENKQYYAAVVENGKVAENSYNLSVTSYVGQEDTREKIDIVKLNAEIKDIVAREDELRAEIDRIIAEIEE
ncbi:MAG: N-6 DNA methylase [Blautia sp.]|nr:N-6 DNA methylase [Lachnoclostridium sp.]MCM1211629.1 N-6 DNA methylase [Blautia sp.]